MPRDDDFTGEAEELLDSLSRDLADFEAQGTNVRPELINKIFRDVHSLKGLAGMLGLTAIAELTHALEDMLDRLRMGRIAIGKPLIDLLYDAIDNLNRLVVGAGDVDTAALTARIESNRQGRGHAENSQRPRRAHARRADAQIADGVRRASPHRERALRQEHLLRRAAFRFLRFRQEAARADREAHRIGRGDLHASLGRSNRRRHRIPVAIRNRPRRRGGRRDRARSESHLPSKSGKRRFPSDRFRPRSASTSRSSTS